jgi:hypothetical protein
MKKMYAIVGGILGVLVGMAFVMPAVALMRDEGALPNFEVGLLFLGVALTVGGAAAAVLGVKQKAA